VLGKQSIEIVVREGLLAVWALGLRGPLEGTGPNALLAPFGTAVWAGMALTTNGIVGLYANWAHLIVHFETVLRREVFQQNSVA